MIRRDNIPLVACLASLLVLSCGQAPSPRDTKADALRFVGKTAAELLDAYHLTLVDCRFVDEPPGVLRELVFSTAQIRVALKREESLFSEQRQWSDEVVRPAHIIGVTHVNP